MCQQGAAIFRGIEAGAQRRQSTTRCNGIRRAGGAGEWMAPVRDMAAGHTATGHSRTASRFSRTRDRDSFA